MGGNVAWRKEVPIRHEVDVFVAGGGPAGVAAAVAAARNGCRVLLAEWTGCLGGLGTAGLVPSFCPMTDGVHVLVGGIALELIDRLHANGGMAAEHRPEQWRFLPFNCEYLKLAYDELVRGSGVTVRLCTALVDVVLRQQDGRSRIEAALLCGREGPYAVRASQFIDGTGDAILSMLAGSPTELGDEHGRTMGPTLCSIFSGVDWARYEAWGQRPRDALPRAIADGVFGAPDLHHSGAWHSGRQLAGMNVGHVYGVNGADDAQLTQGLMDSRRQLLEFLRFYRQYVPGFEDVELAASGSILGVRETRRVVGEYVLSAEDFVARRSFPDEIGRYNYPIDIHPATASRQDYERFVSEHLEQYRMAAGESYGIPYRSLIPQGVANLLVAGRCFSTDRKMQGSTRVMPCCFLTGQAAGAAAALSVAKGCNPREADPIELRAALRAAGAYLP